MLNKQLPGIFFTRKEPENLDFLAISSLFEIFSKLKDNNELSEDNALDLELLNYLRDQNTDT